MTASASHTPQGIPTTSTSCPRSWASTCIPGPGPSAPSTLSPSFLSKFSLCQRFLKRSSTRSNLIRKSDKSCLDNTPSTYIPNKTRRLPGEIYSLTHQCQLIFGNSSAHCPNDDECQRLWCNGANLNNMEQCRSSNLPWADGTPCGYSDHWCLKGRCVPRQGSNQPKVSGGWGPWSAFTSCSLPCGGGVQESHRECDNPKPDGGKFCVGSRKKYRSCNTHVCPPGHLDPREQQCMDMNGVNMNIPGIDPNNRWLPKYESK